MTIRPTRVYHIRLVPRGRGRGRGRGGGDSWTSYLQYTRCYARAGVDYGYTVPALLRQRLYRINPPVRAPRPRSNRRRHRHGTDRVRADGRRRQAASRRVDVFGAIVRPEEKPKNRTIAGPDQTS